MLNRPRFLFQADDKGGGLASPPEQSGQKNLDPNASGDEMPDWIKDHNKAWAEIKKLREEAGAYRTDRNKQREEFEAFKKTLFETIDTRLPKKDDEKPESDPLKAMAARLEAFEQQQKAVMESSAKERKEALRLKVAAEIFGDKVTGENKAQMLEVLAARLSGDTEDALREDAKVLAALMPATNPQWQNNTKNASPGGNPVEETDAQRLARIRSGGEAKTSFG